MTSTFRLTKAEFKKVFKRPSVFLMALILVASVFLSLYLFKPNEIADTTITYNETNSQGYFDRFHNDPSYNAKSGIDEITQNSDEIVAYYTYLNDRNNNLDSYHANILTIFDELRLATDLNVREEKYTAFKNALDVFYSAYLTFDQLTDYPFINYTVDYSRYKVNGAQALINLIDYCKTNTSLSLVNKFLVKENDEYGKLQTTLNNAQNFVIITLDGMSSDIKHYHENYYDYVENGSAYINAIEQSRNNLSVALDKYLAYLELVSDSQFPIILVNANHMKSIQQLIQQAKATITLSVSEREDYTKQRLARDQIYSLSIIKPLQAFSQSITQIFPNNELIRSIKAIQTKVQTNQIVLVDKISSLKNDEGISKISTAITEYKLLAESYRDYLNAKIGLYIVSDYDKSVYTHFYELSQFNVYQSTEILTISTYYIDNNIYSNSFLNNFAFNQNSSTKTNVFDFIYFALEICTVVIIFFAMLLLCNLITAETESGTIKLLLVRPYKRSKIITAKLMTTLYFVIVFLLFSTALAVAGGLSMFEYTNQSVLMIFNATTPVVISPILLMLINIGTLFLDVIFFALIALMLSVLFKNFAGSVSFSLIALMLNFGLNILFSGSFWYSLLPAMNLHLFKFFGNAFLPTESTIVQSMLVPSIESSMNIIYSLLLNFGYMLIALAVSYSVFEKRDY